MRRLRAVLWAVAAAWALALALAGWVVVRGGARPGPLLSPGQAATAADVSVHLVASGPAKRAATLSAIEPGGAVGAVDVGGGVQLVDFFATWCHACNLDMATMKRYATLAERRGLPPLVAVDLRVAEPSTAYVKRFARTAGLTFPVALDRTGAVTDAYDVTVLPTLVLVAQGGKVLWRHTGIVDLGTLLSAVKSHAGRG